MAGAAIEVDEALAGGAIAMPEEDSALDPVGIVLDVLAAKSARMVAKRASSMAMAVDTPRRAARVGLRSC
jgi:hypothetical protein